MATLITMPIEERIILYLSDFEPLDEVYETTIDLTQKGIAQNVGVQRKHVSRYLKKLMDSELITEKRCHVVGAKQRMKCYYLSWDGKRKAADIREHISRKKLKIMMDGHVEEMLISDIDGATSVHLTLSDIVNEALKAEKYLDKELLENIEERKRREVDERTRKSDIYRKAMLAAWRNGVLTPSEKHLIDALKEHLGVSDEEHDLMESEIINTVNNGRLELIELYSEVSDIIGRQPTKREKEVLELFRERLKI